MLNKIIKELEELKHYETYTIHEDTFVDNNQEYLVYTIVLCGIYKDYKKLLEVERKISRNLNLYEQNIMLELV